MLLRAHTKTTSVTKPINVVVDLSHHNEAIDFLKIKADGLPGVIHKASQGLTYVDKSYASRRSKAVDCGLLWGASHFGVGGDGSDQAEFFLKATNPDDQTLLVLDYESNLTGPTMSLIEN